MWSGRARTTRRKQPELLVYEKEVSLNNKESVDFLSRLTGARGVESYHYVVDIKMYYRTVSIAIK